MNFEIEDKFPTKNFIRLCNENIAYRKLLCELSIIAPLLVKFEGKRVTKRMSEPIITAVNEIKAKRPELGISNVYYQEEYDNFKVKISYQICVDERNSHGGSTYYKTNHLEIRLGCRKVYGTMQRDQECEIFKMARFLDENRHVVNLEDNQKAITGYEQAIYDEPKIRQNYEKLSLGCSMFMNKLATYGVQYCLKF